MHNWIKRLFSASEQNTDARPVTDSPDARLPLTQLGGDAESNEQGDAHLHNGEYAAAAQCYRKAISINPVNAKTHNSLGFALKEQGLLLEAETCLNRTLALDPTIADAHYILGTLSQAQGKNDIACAHFRKTLTLAPDFEFAYRDLCVLLFQQGRLDDAKQVAIDGIALNPRFADLHFYLGNLHHEQQHLDSAIDSYQDALALQPDRPEILVSLGLILLKKEDFCQAAFVLRKALTLAPNLANTHNLLGTALLAQNKFDEAIASYRTALNIDPKLSDAHFNLGNALRAVGQFDDAAESYRGALRLEPDFSDAHHNLGLALYDLGQPDAAARCYRRALEIKPDFAEAHGNLGNALQKIGHLDEAVACYHLALQIKPDSAEIHNNLGTALHDLGQLEDATACFRTALQLKPEYAEAHSNLGIVLQDMGQLTKAADCFRIALQIKPDYAEAHSNLGRALQDMGQLDKAVDCFRTALQITPDNAKMYINLGNGLISIGRLDDAITSSRQALQIAPRLFEAHDGLLYTYNFLSVQPAAKALADARRFGDLIEQEARPYTNWSNARDVGRRLRIGLVSGDFRSHPVGYFAESVLTALTANSSEKLELIAYTNHFSSDLLTERIKYCCQSWHCVVRLSDENLAKQIRDDGIDILIDLSGHTAHNRLPMFAWKPAPVQVTWLGYFATTGVAAIDYLIADPWTLPAAEESHFTETIWRLPETRLCFTPPDADVQVAALPAATNRFITFGCFNNLAKINDDVVALWARLLQAIPESRLFLKAKSLDAIEVRVRLTARFANHGIETSRLMLEGFSSRSDYLSAYHRVDIALDPFPYTGGTTTAEALWMGVPVLTLAGKRFISRQGVGLLMNAGLPDWIAADADDYVARAVRHASDFQRLAALRSGLREQVLRSPIFDAPRFARHFEAALRGMWAHWCKQEQ